METNRDTKPDTYKAIFPIVHEYVLKEVDNIWRIKIRFP